MEEQSERYLFEEMPVPRAVTTLAIPTIISQVVTMIYNLADTFFIGQIGDPGMVAAVSLVSPWFNLLTALGNLFGLGGGYPETAMAYALAGIEWSVGTVTVRTKRTWTSTEKNALSILRNTADLHGGDLVLTAPTVWCIC